MKIISSSIYLGFVAVVLASLCFLPQVQAVIPPPDGGYPNFTTAEGDNALKALTTGVGNTAVGTFSLFSLSTGNFNTAVGAGALDLNQAESNTATGAAALLFNTAGTQNTAVGTAALELNDTGSNNTANGAFALFNNVDAQDNTATGYKALASNTTGGGNTAVGSQALASNTQSTSNTAVGLNALTTNIGGGNSAFGAGALKNKQFGGLNTAMGVNALFSLTGATNLNSGNNTALGAFALLGLTAGESNTAVGLEAGQHLITGGRNTIMGFQAGTNLNTGDGNIYIDSPGAATESNTIRIGNAHVTTFIAGINGVDEGNPTAVFINTATGQLGTIPPPSSRRYKKGIKSMDKASDTILALKPVTFQYRSDKTGTPQFGLIAEEVAKVNPALVLSDKEGKPYTVRYDAVNAMLLNEFLKEHRTVQEQGQELQKQATTIATQQEQIEALTAGLQKVSAQLAAASPSFADLH